MSEWLERMRRRLLGGDRAERARSVLSAAHRQRAALRLKEIGLSSSENWLTATIEQVGTDHFKINQPTSGGVAVQLVTGGDIEFSIEIGEQQWTGRTRNLGRDKITAGAGGVIRGYRLAMPDGLHAASKRRAAFRLRVGADLAPRATLQLDSDPRQRIDATIHDLSVGGALLIIKGDLSECEPGDAGCLRFQLPDPVGEVEVRVCVQSTVYRDRAPALGIRFEQEIPHLAQFIRAAEIKRLQRAGAA